MMGSCCQLKKQASLPNILILATVSVMISSKKKSNLGYMLIVTTNKSRTMIYMMLKY